MEETLWLCGWLRAKKEEKNGYMRAWDWEGKTNVCSAGLGFGREMKVAISYLVDEQWMIEFFWVWEARVWDLRGAESKEKRGKMRAAE